MQKAMRFFCLCLLLHSAGLRSALGQAEQTGEVTFFSHASLTKALLLPYTSDAAFNGWVYDGDRKLGAVLYNQFLTFALPAGPHHISATISGKHPDKRVDLLLEVTAGQHQFVRLSSNYEYAVVVTLQKAAATVVSCGEAQQQASGTKPGKEKRVPKALRATLVSERTFPGCG